jgi:outer membrane lipoprotein-sorting protein
MDRRRATLGAAGVGVVAGAVALALVASPAGAGQSPTLPKTTPDALVQSILTAQLPAMSGTVEVDNSLGLPEIPGLPQFARSGSQVRVWTDGQQRSRISIPSTASEQTIVDDGTTVYAWNSDGRTVVEHSVGNVDKHASSQKEQSSRTDTQDLNPAQAAVDIVSSLQKTSTVSVDGTNMVANRPAYDLVLTPKAGEHTLLREVQIAVDSQTRLPLQLTVLAENTNTPALQVGFTSIDFGPQDPSLFHFTPPAGATVTNGDKQDDRSAAMASKAQPKLVGDGWDTVIVAQVPTSTTNSRGTNGGMLNMVRNIGKPVQGAWGSGWVISTNVGNAVLTSDGRIAAGFVPQQLLFQALSK